jgi:hypothetical protein
VLDFCPALSQVGLRFTIVRGVRHIVVAPAFGVFCPNAPDALFLSPNFLLEPFTSTLDSKFASGVESYFDPLRSELQAVNLSANFVATIPAIGPL